MECLIGWGSPFDADDYTYKVFGTDKGANYSSYSNAKVDEYLTLARQYEDKETRKKYYDLFQEELAKDSAYAFICYIDANYVADNKIQGISLWYRYDGQRYFFYDMVWWASVLMYWCCGDSYLHCYCSCFWNSKRNGTGGLFRGFYFAST